jgi:hypothetical protein
MRRDRPDGTWWVLLAADPALRSYEIFIIVPMSALKDLKDIKDNKDRGDPEDIGSVRINRTQYKRAESRFGIFSRCPNGSNNNHREP